MPTPIATAIATVIATATPVATIAPPPSTSGVIASTIPLIIKWLSGGTTGIGLGILGGGVALGVLWFWIKKAKATYKEAKFQMGINTANTIAGKESLEVSEQAEKTANSMNDWISKAQAAMAADPNSPKPTDTSLPPVATPMEEPWQCPFCSPVITNGTDTAKCNKCNAEAPVFNVPKDAKQNANIVVGIDRLPAGTQVWLDDVNFQFDILSSNKTFSLAMFASGQRSIDLRFKNGAKWRRYITIIK